MEPTTSQNDDDQLANSKRTLSRINGLVNEMTMQQIIDKLKQLDVSTNGEDNVLKQRLKGVMREKVYKNSNIKSSKFSTDYYCVIDFEATCEEVNPRKYKHEIIEFPALMVNARTLAVESQFHFYCRPVMNPKLSSFCTKLTGIDQKTIDSADAFKVVFQNFQKWLEDVLGESTFVVVTDGPFDITRFLTIQCKVDKIPMPYWASNWTNLKRTFKAFYKLSGQRFPTLQDMLGALKIPHDGRLHSGIDDAKNIAKILCQLIRDGCQVKPNEILANYS
ncbi:uncharacterized protein TRIADDRAFT_28382 [Trichoplax adhaerens]|uniref:Exonuclease domain-containing protein n=1 Tax=Trichoplax adhaerens TaxID=10228 RepID=B3S2Z3_TRIAD|nr:hypothetical protein TRIADDRAFT_28382 [Trichoplax adhaerens]EDV22875.1 hypothetical protein TRIADDRAFT_28382 [Trichoplax adhaerens]|eukprot:XP_002114741.1 hypothetical protein TRIADDRAFT_28382 [Trichoplax adhaerens]